jgi:hypothetical protein
MSAGVGGSKTDEQLWDEGLLMMGACRMSFITGAGGSDGFRLALADLGFWLAEETLTAEGGGAGALGASGRRLASAGGEWSQRHPGRVHRRPDASCSGHRVTV